MELEGAFDVLGNLGTRGSPHLLWFAVAAVIITLSSALAALGSPNTFLQRF
jgi:hypothetical protein